MRRKTGQFVAGLLFAAFAAVCPNLHAQASSDPHWLLQYRGIDPYHRDSANRLKWDKRFEPFVNHYLPMKQTLWEKGKAIGAVASDFLGVPGSIHIEAEHYYSADGCVAHACFEKGMLWVDMKTTPPIVAFAATDIRKGTKDNGYRLYLFISREFGAGELPAELRNSIARWTALPYGGGDEVEVITQAVIVGPDGQDKIVEPKTLGVAEAAQEKSDKQ
ncbi:MAG: hypothetical protein P4K86_05185 [Terracidiphilus sp.]|nr:hypothetical protein [Terracidiphilus sp.]MDR3775590.1 hypothetical protein [Terracidiphilus sp.]